METLLLRRLSEAYVNFISESYGVIFMNTLSRVLVAARSRSALIIAAVMTGVAARPEDDDAAPSYSLAFACGLLITNNRSIMGRTISLTGKAAMLSASSAFIFIALRTKKDIKIETAIFSEGGKDVLIQALKAARKPALRVATGITYVACLPLNGAPASRGLCIACGILIAKLIR